MSDAAPNIPREEFLALFQDVAVSITSSLSLEETLDLIVRRTAEAFDVWECDLFEYSPETDCDDRHAPCGRASHRRPTRSGWAAASRSSDWPIYRIGARRGTASSRSTSTTPTSTSPPAASCAQWGETAVLTAPLKYREQTLGFLSLVDKTPGRRFTPEDCEALRNLAVPVAIAVHNARMYRRQEERARHLTSLADASRAITSSVVLEDVLELVTERAGMALGSSQCMIYEYDAERDATISRALYEAPGCEDPDYEGLGTVYPLDEYPSDRAILEGRRSSRST